MKKVIKKLIFRTVQYFPSNFQNWIVRKIKKKNADFYSQIINELLRNYIARTDFDNLDVSKMPTCNIESLEWDYQLFNMAFVVNVLRNIVYCLYNGFRPVVMFHYSQNKSNLWEEFLEQPFFSVCSANEKDKEIVCDVQGSFLQFPVNPTKLDIEIFSKLYKVFVVPNKKTREYIQREYKTLLDGKRVLGVLVRGTDYVAGKPKWHPVQPEVSEVLEDVRRIMEKRKYDAIYLATEELAIQEQFKKAFPEKIIINKRKYFDSYYDIKKVNKDALISAVHFERENDNYYKGLEYFSSIVLLSKCTALIAGNCGGSRAALYMNDNAYEYVYLYDKGIY